METQSNARVGIAVLLIKEDKILLGKRIGSHGSGTWALPGGHLEFKEHPDYCAKREILEETGINLNTNGIDCGWTNDIFNKENKHYITLYLKYFVNNTEKAEIKEPNKCEEWKWFSENEIPKNNLFIPLENFFEKYEIGNIMKKN